MKKAPKFSQLAGPLLAGACLLGLAGTAAFGQADSLAATGEATIYRDAVYRGPAVYVNEPKPNLGLAWPVNSIRVTSGRWQLCERTRYRGECRTVEGDTPVLGTLLRGMTVQSMRPVRSDNGPGPGIGVEANDQVTRGNFAEFHTQPASRGYRIPSCPDGQSTANCAAVTADNYCRSIGWNGSAREHQETVNRRGVYLADVLCVTSGF